MNRRSWTFVLLVYAASTLPSAAARDVASLQACRAMMDPAKRLECFDRAAAMLAPDPLPIDRPTQDPAQQFGLPERAIVAREVAVGARPSEAAKIEAHIVQLAPAAGGRLVFTLDNDQVWRQLIAEGELLAKTGDAVIISRGALGSYWLQLKSGRGCKVTRVH